jgi:hypothetical protein
MNLYESSTCSTSSKRTASQRAEPTSSFDFPRTIERDVAEAGELLQRLLGLDGQAGQLPDHEVHHIVGVSLGVNAIELPAPARDVMIEAKQPLVGERRNELNGEKWIATCLLVHQ